MAKQFLANRSGQTPTLDEVPNETIKIYPTEADLDADLANLEENEIVATEEDNNPASGTQYPVDVVQNGNMNAVTSNAAYNYAASLLPKPVGEFSSFTEIATLGSFTQITLEEGYYCIRTVASSNVSNGYIASAVGGSTFPIASFDGSGNGQLAGFTIYLKAGNYYISGTNAALYKLGE